ncbi:MAG TPA: GNAT family N-acetyltransferase [Flavipsychrobacter sp.]|nr:GNAT family N-acetyltransferase [Flavipsychrobacter sp.]
MDNIQIRSATIEDGISVYKLICELESYTLDKEVFNVNFRRNLNSSNIHYLVATMDNHIAGFISSHGQILLHHEGLVYEIQEIVVSNEHRSKGIGKKLLHELESIISKEDYKLLEVACNMKRKDAHRFYLANGFDQTHYKFTKEKQ